MIRWLALPVVLAMSTAAMAQQQPTPEQIAQARIAAVSVNLGNLRGSLEAMSDAYHRATMEIVELRKQLAEATEKCGEACKAKPNTTP